jgi:4-hydroxybenzoate polyprenyltransferase
MDFKHVLNLLRPQEYIPTSFILVLVTSSTASGNLAIALPILLFAILSNAFGFVINDIADCELDRLNPKTRNPVAKNKVSKKSAWLIGALFLLLSVAVIFQQPSWIVIPGIIVIFEFLTYSFFIRAKSKPYLDMVYHGTCIALFAFMAYSFYRPIDSLGLSVVAFSFLASVSIEVLQEIRDYKNDKKMIKNTVVSLGKKKSLYLINVMIFLSFILYALLAITGIIPFVMVFLAPMSMVLVYTVVKALKSNKLQKELFYTLPRRAFIIIVIIFALYAFLMFY